MRSLTCAASVMKVSTTTYSWSSTIKTNINRRKKENNMGYPGYTEISFQEALALSSTKRNPLGTRGIISETGQVFRYVCWADAVPAGVPVVSGADGEWQTSTNTALSGTTWVSTTWGSLTMSSTWAEPQGDTDGFASGSTGCIKNMFADGFLFTGSTEGKGGQMVAIESNTTGSTASGTVTLVFKEDSRFTVDWDTETRFAINRNPYAQPRHLMAARLRENVLIGVAPRG